MNDFLEWLDEQDDPAPRQAEGWICDTIEKAEGAARRLRAARDKIIENEKVADRIAADAAAWCAEACARYQRIEDAERANLETFLRIQIEQGGPKSAPLPWGVSVKARKTGGTLDLSKLDPEAAPEAIVVSKPRIDAKLAKAYYIVTGDGIVVDPNGEVVEAVTVKPVEDRFEVVA